MTVQVNAKPKILIVDDNSLAMQEACESLALDDYDIAIAHNGKEGLEIAEKTTPDLILLDVVMPVMGGFDACRELKKRDHLKDIPVIFQSSRKSEICEGFRAGGVDYITKPYIRDEFRQRVRTHLELKLQREQIERESERRKELLHMLFHDLRNPIGKVQNCMDILDVSPALQDELFPIIRTSAKHGLDLLSIIGEMLAVADGKRAVKCRYHKLRQLFDESLMILSDRFSLKQVKVLSNIDPNIEVYVEDITFIHSVANNLLTNAVKFSEPGSIITINFIREDEDTYTFSVKDVGVGMPQEILENIFNVTASISRTGTNGERGTGFGMPLVKSFIDLYGGSVAVESTEPSPDRYDHGTEIFVTLKQK